VCLSRTSPHGSLRSGAQEEWFRGHLLRKKGFFGQWKPHTYLKKGAYLFEFKPGANHVKADPLNIFHLSGSLAETAKTLTGKDFSFLLHTRDGKSYFLEARTKEEMEDWMDVLSLRPRRHVNNQGADRDQHSPEPKLDKSSSNHSTSDTLATMTEEEVRNLPIFTILEDFTDAIVACNPAGLVIGFNKAAEKMFGYSANEIKGKGLKILMPEPYRSAHDGYMFRHEKFGESKLIGNSRGLPGMRKNGEVFKMQLSLGKLPAPGYFIATLREITPEVEDQEKQGAD